MREIKFRGKDVNTNEWVYGSYMYWNDNTGNPVKHTFKERHYIYSYYCPDFNMGGWDEVEVILETVGQYTGLKDKNGKEIYEGDIVHFLGGEYEQGFYEYDRKIVIKDLINDGYDILESSNFGTVEVIGNIHDNPELLKEED